MNMKYPIAVLTILVILAAGIIYLGAATVTPKQMTITGEVVDLHCYMHSALKGPGHEACAITCAKSGEPVGILENKTNRVYLALGAEHGTPGQLSPGTKLLLPYMAKQVTVKGELFDRGGLKAIVIQKVTKA